ncbi:hypothetical protein J3459_015770 [Metarhizium acridum]|nr:hypothetical protein J3459_015770 [Metarhizium acridum]
MAVQASNGNFAPPVAPVCARRLLQRLDDFGLLSSPPVMPAPWPTPRTWACSRAAPAPQGRPAVTDLCSNIVPSMCVNLTCGAPSVYANFKTGLDYNCESGSDSSSKPTACIKSPGSWSVIFGAWVGGRRLWRRQQKPHQHGQLPGSVWQRYPSPREARNPPQLDRSSFKGPDISWATIHSPNLPACAPIHGAK